VGLAEDSPNLPLKTLHPLLEDGTEGADKQQEVGVCEGRGVRGGKTASVCSVCSSVISELLTLEY